MTPKQVINRGRLIRAALKEGRVPKFLAPRPGRIAIGWGKMVDGRAFVARTEFFKTREAAEDKIGRLKRAWPSWDTCTMAFPARFGDVWMVTSSRPSRRSFKRRAVEVVYTPGDRVVFDGPFGKETGTVEDADGKMIDIIADDGTLFVLDANAGGIRRCSR